MNPDAAQAKTDLQTVGQSDTPNLNPAPSIPDISTQPNNPSEKNTQAQEDILTPPNSNINIGELPQTFTSETVKAPRKKINIKIISSVLLLLFVLLVISLFGVSYAIAYEKINLPKYPKLQAKITQIIVGLPFMPKTPKFLIAKTLLAHQKVTKQSFNISLALESAGLTNIVGTNTTELETKGSIDYSNPENIIFSMEANLTKDFGMELKKKDKFLYFKVNKLPSLMIAMFGMEVSTFDPILNKWIAYDTTPLNTEAGKELKDKEVKPLSYELINDMSKKYLTDKILEQTKIEEVAEDGVKFYKMSVDMDKELIDYIDQNIVRKESGAYYTPSSSSTPALSEIIKSLKWSIYFNRYSYHTQKITVTSDMEFDQGIYGSAFLGTSDNLVENSKAKFALVIKFGDFGKEVVVDTPTEFMSQEEFMNEISNIMQGTWLGYLQKESAYPPNLPKETLQEQTFSANDAKRKADLLSLKSTLEMYFADSKKYPSNLTDLNQYLLTIPKDPNGSEYYYLVSEDKQSYDLCGNLETPDPAPVSICPDPNYNYHLSQP